MISGAISKFMDAPKTPHTIAEIGRLNEQRYAVIAAFGRARNLSRIFLSAETTGVLSSMEEGFSRNTQENEYRMTVCDAIEKALPSLFAAARKDLAVNAF